jgi:hypothetical protein
MKVNPKLSYNKKSNRIFRLIRLLFCKKKETINFLQIFYKMQNNTENNFKIIFF